MSFLESFLLNISSFVNILGGISTAWKPVLPASNAFPNQSECDFYTSISRGHGIMLSMLGMTEFAFQSQNKEVKRNLASLIIFGDLAYLSLNLIPIFKYGFMNGVPDDFKKTTIFGLIWAPLEILAMSYICHENWDIENEN